MPARRTAAVGMHTDGSTATVASDSGREPGSLAKRLRELAERLPPGGSLTITRDALLGLAAGERCGSEHAVASPDLTVAELGERFHRSPSTIRGWCEHGRFEGAYKLHGRDWRVPQLAVEAFLAQQRRQPQVSIFTVSRELGHGSESLVKRIYGHLGTVRHRAKVVEYRVEQHKKVLKEQLAALRSGWGSIKLALFVALFGGPLRSRTVSCCAVATRP